MVIPRPEPLLASFTTNIPLLGIMDSENRREINI